MLYSVCIPAVFRGEKTEDVLWAVKDAGFGYYEFWGWENQDLDACLAAQQKNQLSLAAMCTQNQFPLVDPACRQDFVEGLKQTAVICKKMGCRTVIATVGQELEGVSREAQHESIVAGLRECVPILEENALTMVVEPLNTRINHKGYYLWSSEEAFQIVDKVGSEQVKVLFDLYHQYIMDDLEIDRIVQNINKIGHFHMAGFPGRHEPMINSEIPYPEILRTIRQSGYRGTVGLEYIPVRDPAEGLKVLFGQLQEISQ